MCKKTKITNETFFKAQCNMGHAMSTRIRVHVRTFWDLTTVQLHSTHQSNNVGICVWCVCVCLWCMVYVCMVCGVVHMCANCKLRDVQNSTVVPYLCVCVRVWMCVCVCGYVHLCFDHGCKQNLLVSSNFFFIFSQAGNAGFCCCCKCRDVL